jgi:hypothetical protein
VGTCARHRLRMMGYDKTIIANDLCATIHRSTAVGFGEVVYEYCEIRYDTVLSILEVHLQRRVPTTRLSRPVFVVPRIPSSRFPHGSPTVEIMIMPAISNNGGFIALKAREWRDTVGQSGMTPTAFSFLIPVFVVAIAAPL